MAQPLVLIHGMSASARTWDPLLPLLCDREVHVVTLPGHRGGAPLRDPEHVSTIDYVDAVETELDRLGLARADLVGNSLGGWVALQLSVDRAGGRDVAHVPRSPCPVLIAWSQHDRILVSRANRRRLQRQVGAPRVTRLPDVGHVPMSDDPFLVADTVLRFTASVPEPA